MQEDRQTAWEAEQRADDAKLVLVAGWVGPIAMPLWIVVDLWAQPDFWWAYLPGHVLFAIACMWIVGACRRAETLAETRRAILGVLLLGGVAVGVSIPLAGDTTWLFVLEYSTLLWASGAVLALPLRTAVGLFTSVLAVGAACFLVIPATQPGIVLFGSAAYLLVAAGISTGSTTVRHGLRERAFQARWELGLRNRELAASRVSLAGERASSAARNAFLKRMSHELRTPLNGILGYAELAEEALLDADIGEVGASLSRVRKAGDHLLGLLGNILDLTAIEAGEVELFPEGFDLCDAVSDVVDGLRPAARTKGLSLQIVGTASRVVQDPARVRQILVAILGNAVRFTEAGGVRIEVAEDGGVATVSVTDTGSGLNTQARMEVFKPFHQSDDSTTRRHDGIGLGLTVSRALARRMGGDLSVESNTGAGSTFVLELPSQRGLMRPDVVEVSDRVH